MPGVYRPQADTTLLMQAMLTATIPLDKRVLDMGTGTGALAIRAAMAGARSVTAVDISWPAIVSAWLNSRARGVRLELLHGELSRVPHRRLFDLVLVNPPYVPSPKKVPSRGPARAWEGGTEGRAVLDVLCRMMPRMLDSHGVGLMVHSALCKPEATLSQLREGGLKAAVVAREMVAFGPKMRKRADWLESAGLIEPGQRHEELVVIRADRTQA
ncbi:HemK2/MTQ2 family protein methyltransferase [Nocardia sp. NPDC051463]|uniref:HemK2/MTQ2 family protein methyltransferase n=1 Tax=Nocardia sp. NPDC051463 TaxID=3154845 RepID=UPI0034152CC5